MTRYIITDLPWVSNLPVILNQFCLFQVLATINPSNFGSQEVCEPLVSLIRNEDLEIGTCVCGCIIHVHANDIVSTLMKFISSSI